MLADGKKKFILIKYENKGYDRKVYSKVMLKRLKVMGGLIFIYTHWGPNSRKFS